MKQSVKNYKQSKKKLKADARIKDLLEDLEEDSRVGVYHLENKTFSGFFGGEIYVAQKLRITDHQIKRLQKIGSTIK